MSDSTTTPRGGQSVISLPQTANNANSSSWARRIFGGKAKDKERALEAEVQVALLQEEERNQSARISQLEASLAVERREKERLRRQLQECDDRFQLERSALLTECRRRQTVEERLRDMELAHALQISGLQHELDEARRQNGRLNSADEQRRMMASEDTATYENRIRAEREDREATQKRCSRLAEESENLRKELEEKTKELSIKDQRLEWMQQRAAAFVHGAKSTP